MMSTSRGRERRSFGGHDLIQFKKKGRTKSCGKSRIVVTTLRALRRSMRVVGRREARNDWTRSTTDNRGNGSIGTVEGSASAGMGRGCAQLAVPFHVSPGPEFRQSSAREAAKRRVGVVEPMPTNPQDVERLLAEKFVTQSSWETKSPFWL